MNRKERRAAAHRTRMPGAPRSYHRPEIVASYNVPDHVNSRHFRRTGGRWYVRYLQRKARRAQEDV